MSFIGLSLHIGLRLASSSGAAIDRWVAASPYPEHGYYQINRFTHDLGSHTAALLIVATSLKVTRFALTKIVFNSAFLTVGIYSLVMLGYRNIYGVDSSKGLDNKMVNLANAISLIGSIAAVSLNAAPLIGIGGVTIAANLLAFYVDSYAPKKTSITYHRLELIP